jgi:hypothetical protein
METCFIGKPSLDGSDVFFLVDFDLTTDFFFSVASDLAAKLTEPCHLFPLAEHKLELQLVHRD